MAWPSIPYVQGVYDRYNKLWKIANGFNAAHANDLAYPGTTNYQLVSLFSNLQTKIRVLGDTAGYHWVQKKDYTGLTTIPFLTWANIVALAPLPLGDWTRKCYREVVDNSSTTDVFTGGAIANGQRAYRRSDKKIVDRVAGAWVINTTAVEPDIITTTGYFQGGDLIGDWLFTEINAVLDVLGAVTISAHWYGGSAGESITANYQSGHNLTTDTTAASAEAAAEADYAGETPVDDYTPPFAYSTLSSNSVGEYFANLDRAINHAVSDAVSDVASATVDFYVIADSNTTIAADFIDEGDPVLYLKLSRWDAGVTPNGTTLAASSVDLGSLASPPNNPWVAAPPLGGTATGGWRAKNPPQAVVVYAV